MEAKMIGIKITEARKKINVSQAQLAVRLFISPQAVGKWERGESFPDIITFIRLAKILGVDLNYFSDEFPSTDPEKPNDESFNSKPTELLNDKPRTKPSWDMSSGNWADADFSGLKNLHEKFNSSNMKNCKFIGSEMSGILLKSNNVDSCDFSNSDLNQSHIQSSNLLKNNFTSCSMKEIVLNKSNIMDCDFTNADFTSAIFESGGFQSNHMTNSVLKSTTFNSMYIAEMLFDVDLQDCCFDNCGFTRVSFQNSILTNTFFKNNKNLKRVKFIDCKADRLTYEFLKIGKADLSGITLLTS